MRVIFFGTAPFAVPSLEQLVAHRHTVEMCVTQPDRAKGRGRHIEPSPVKCAATQLGLPLTQPERVSASVCEGLHPEVGIVAAYGQLIGRDVLQLPTQGMLGVHPSLLPKYRGAAPVAAAILDGVTRTGVTIFRLDERLDAGDIISQRALDIAPGEDAQALTERLAQLGAQELLSALDAMAVSRVTFTPQDESQASVAPKLTKAQGHMDWSLPAERLERLARAMIPWPGATTAWRGRSLKIWSVAVGAAVSRDPSGACIPPGTVIEAGPEALTVATGTQPLLLRELQPSGRRRMRVREFLAGYPVQVGERLGDHT